MRSWIFLVLLSLSLLSQSWSLGHQEWENILSCLYPFAFFIPMIEFNKNDSGGMSWVLPLLLFSLYETLFGNGHPLTIAILAILMGINTTHRELPIILKATLVFLCGALLIQLFMLQAYLWLGTATLVIFLQIIEKIEWSKHKCISTTGAWGTLSLLCLALFLGSGRVAMPIHLLFCYLLIVITSIDHCRMCMVPVRCRELIVSNSGRAIILAYTLALAMGQAIEPLHLIWLFFFALGPELAKLRQLKPLKIEHFPDNPCTQEFAK